MIDIVSYVLGSKSGEKKGAGTIIIDGDSYTFTDEENDGNIVITQSEE